jgi:hypothetical protein
LRPASPRHGRQVYPGGVLPVTPVTKPINIGFFARRTREQTRDKGVPDPCQGVPKGRSAGVLECWSVGKPGGEIPPDV